MSAVFRGEVPAGRWAVTADETQIILTAEFCPACDAPTWSSLRRGRLAVYVCLCGASFQGADVERREERLAHGLGVVPTFVDAAPTDAAGTVAVIAFTVHGLMR